MDELRSELLHAYSSAQAPGWHGGEGEPVRPETFEEAKRFLDSLPEFYRPTDVYPEPDGDLAFEWYRARNELMIVSFDGSRRAIYVVRLPGERGSGQVQFVDRVPDVISMHLQRFFEIGATR